MKQPLYMLSRRAMQPFPAHGCVSECEDVLAEVLGAIIVSPRDSEESVEFVRCAEGAAPDLLVVALTQSELVRSLQAAKGWRRRFGRVWGYLFDSALRPEELARSPLRRKVSRFGRTFASLDHLFVSCRQAVDMISACYPVPVTYVPLAADVLRFGSLQSSRPITVNGYGRQHPVHLAALADAFNHNRTDRALYYTSHLSAMHVGDLAGHRAFFWKMLSMSRIALAYDIVRVGGKRSMPFSFVGQRWFESLAAGCVVVGYRPECDEADELLNWPDATIECPEPVDEFLAFIDRLLADEDRLDAARRANVHHMASLHDWAYRGRQMAQVLGIRPEAAMDHRMASLSRLAWSAQGVERAVA